MFSVIVTAYNRREYVRSAVDSVLAQTLDPSDFEILVIKNFVDPTIDPYLASRGVRILFDDSKGTGAMLSHAIREARGEFVSFLDDDDDYLPERLARLKEFVEQDPSIHFLRGAHRCMDSTGRVSPDSPTIGPRSTVYLRVVDANRYASVRALYWSGAWMSPSTMVMRRDLFTPVLDRMATIPVGMDFFYLSLALSRAGTIVVDAAALTRYRMHADSNAARAQRSPDDPHRAWLLKEYREAFREQFVRSRGTFAESWCRWTYLQSTFAAFVGGAGTPPPSLVEHVQFAYAIARVRDWEKIRLLTLSLVARIAPGAARRTAWRLETARTSRYLAQRLGGS